VEKVSDLISPVKPSRKRKNELLYDQLLQGTLDHLNPDERRHIEPVLINFAIVFYVGKSNDFKVPKLSSIKY
jgi:hypothetical protein